MHTPRHGRRVRSFFSAVALMAAAFVAASCASPVDSQGLGGAGGGGECGGAKTACDTGCVDITTDPFHCGACDHVCASKECVDGKCTSACAAPLTECEGTCIDTSSDPDNCGHCGLACEAPLVCSSGACGAACDTGKVNCLGVCLDLNVDANNCGECGKVCAAEAACIGGVCESLCPPGHHYCTDTCANLEIDEQNCGSCSNACAADETCEEGACTKICAPPEAYCSGPCVDLKTDLAHCGACGFACAAQQSCTNGVCVCPGGPCGSCAAIDLGDTVPQTVSGTTINQTDSLEGSCSEQSPEVVYQLTAPTTAHYVFHATATYDVAVYLRSSAGCGETQCKTGNFSAAPGVDLVAGEVVYVVVDGYMDQGNYSLEITSGPILPCPGDALGPLPATKIGTTVGAQDNVTPSCSPSSAAGEATFSFTAPTDGTYHFDTAGSDFDTVLHVLDGTCSGASLGCDDDGMSPQSSVNVQLAANQTVVVVVDGYSDHEGSFVLNAIEIVVPECPETDLGSTLPQSTNGTTAGPSYMAGSCGGDTAPERTFRFTAPQAGQYTFSTEGTAFDTVLYVLDGACDGQELDCNDDAVGLQSEVTLSLSAGQSVVVVADGYDTDSGPFVLSIE